MLNIPRNETISPVQAGISSDDMPRTFAAYDSKQEYPAPDGKRIVKCQYRQVDGKVSRQSEYAFIPDWIDEELVTGNMPALIDYVIGYLHSVEDTRIQKMHKEGSVFLGDSIFTLPDLLDYLEETSTSGRLSKEVIATWYKASGLAQAVTGLYQDTTGSKEKADTISRFVSKKLQELASPKCWWKPEQKGKLLPLLELVEDSMSKKLVRKVAAMQEVDTNDVLDML